MKVLFVSSGNSNLGISPIIKRQGDSLENSGITVAYYRIQGKGLKGYSANIIPLRRLIQQFKPDIVHAHYSLSAFVATLSCAKPLVVSLMGSDVHSTGVLKWLIKFSGWFIWNRTIVKSNDMKQKLGLKKVDVIPNGINLEVFNSADKENGRQKLGWTNESKHILFAANPARPEKNFKLTKEAITCLNENIELHTLTDVPPDEIPLWMNASDVILLTSMREGSPNVIKEAMACNLPVVATDVGDIRWLFGEVPGHFLSSFNKDELAQNVELALNFSEENGRTRGRERIVELGLDAESVAQQLVKIYREVLVING